MKNMILAVIAAFIVLGVVAGIGGTGRSSDADLQAGPMIERTTKSEPAMTVESSGGFVEEPPVRVEGDGGGSFVDNGRNSLLTRIAAETDCDALLVEFETAFAHHERNVALGKTELAELNTTYVIAATERLQELGCYE